MGSLGDNDVKAAEFTEPLDSQLSPSSCPGHQDDAGSVNEWDCLESTQLLYDNTPVEDALETQEMNFADETQVLSIASETQVLDDIDGVENINTQLLDETDEVPVDSKNEGTDGTKILEKIDDLSTDNPQCKDSAQSVACKNIQSEPFCGHGEKKISEPSNAIPDEQTGSGRKPPLFTYIRVQSLRESAHAIRNKALKQNNGETKSVTGTSEPLEPLLLKDDRESFLVGSEKGREFDHGKCSEEMGEFWNKNKCKVASSVVRRLFDNDLPTENKGPSLNREDIYGGEGLANLSNYDNELAGLSYINSQEPGELSQANALDFIDRFLQENLIEFDQEANHGKKLQEKSKSLPSTKGQQCLAKKANDKGKAVKTGVFDWDDSREDECGGDILIRRREDIFGSESHRQKSCPQVQNAKESRPKDGDKQLCISNKRINTVHSDSKLLLHNLKVSGNTAQEMATKTRRNLANEMEANVEFSRGQMEPIATAADAPEMSGVGLDTQMAAEAMEELCIGEGIVSHDATYVAKSSLTDQLNDYSAQKTKEITSKEHTGKCDRKMKEKFTKETWQLCEKNNLKKRSKRSKLKVEDNLTSNASENASEMPSQNRKKRKSAGASKRHPIEKLNNCTVNKSRSGERLVDKRQKQGGVSDFTPVAYRTRQSSALNQSMKPASLSRNFRVADREVVSLEKINSDIGIQVLKALDPELAVVCSDDFGVDENTKLPAKLSCDDNGTEIDTVDCPRRRRSLRKLSSGDKGSEKLGGSVKESAHSEDIAKSTGADSPLSGKSFGDTSLVESPTDRYKPSGPASLTPAGHKTLVNDASPICMGDDYYKQSCNRNVSTSCLVKVPRKELSRELRSLSARGSEPTTPSRKRRDMNDVRILCSNHLDEDIVRHQKKILARLGASVASSITDATHFVADQFVRTRNMLVAIASGKPVVTHLWIESCGQASCFIDEKNYILRDSKKEKEFGFSMPVSLARASRHPLLEGRRVFITPNTKPNRETISSLVKAVQGEAVERIGRSALKDDKIPDNLLVLSCEEDYSICLPFLEKGAAVYGSELLLNGIVTQKLEYESHVLFADNVKKTRSTIWLKRDGKTFLPVTNCK